MGKTLETILKRSFRAAKCLAMLKLTTSRIKLLRNKKTMAVKQMRKEIASLLQSGQDTHAYIVKVDILIKEENTLSAFDLIDQFCHSIVTRLPMIETQKNCPIDMKEPICSLIFAAPRCPDLGELMSVREMFTSKYGKEFATAASELRPDCGVNRLLIEKLSTRPASGQMKVKVMKDIASENKIKWTPADELSKAPESTTSDAIKPALQSASDKVQPAESSKGGQSTFPAPQYPTRLNVQAQPPTESRADIASSSAQVDVQSPDEGSTHVEWHDVLDKFDDDSKSYANRDDQDIEISESGREEVQDIGPKLSQVISDVQIQRARNDSGGGTKFMEEEAFGQETPHIVPQSKEADGVKHPGKLAVGLQSNQQNASLKSSRKEERPYSVSMSKHEIVMETSVTKNEESTSVTEAVCQATPSTVTKPSDETGLLKPSGSSKELLQEQFKLLKQLSSRVKQEPVPLRSEEEGNDAIGNRSSLKLSSKVNRLEESPSSMSSRHNLAFKTSMKESSSAEEHYAMNNEDLLPLTASRKGIQKDNANVLEQIGSAVKLGAPVFDSFDSDGSSTNITARPGSKDHSLSLKASELDTDFPSQHDVPFGEEYHKKIELMPPANAIENVHEDEEPSDGVVRFRRTSIRGKVNVDQENDYGTGNTLVSKLVTKLSSFSHGSVKVEEDDYDGSSYTQASKLGPKVSSLSSKASELDESPFSLSSKHKLPSSIFRKNSSISSESDPSARVDEDSKPKFDDDGHISEEEPFTEQTISFETDGMKLTDNYGHISEEEPFTEQKVRFDDDEVEPADNFWLPSHGHRPLSSRKEEEQPVEDRLMFDEVHASCEDAFLENMPWTEPASSGKPFSSQQGSRLAAEKPLFDVGTEEVRMSRPMGQSKKSNGKKEPADGDGPTRLTTADEYYQDSSAATSIPQKQLKWNSKTSKASGEEDIAVGDMKPSEDKLSKVYSVRSKRATGFTAEKEQRNEWLSNVDERQEQQPLRRSKLRPASPLLFGDTDESPSTSITYSNYSKNKGPSSFHSLRKKEMHEIQEEEEEEEAYQPLSTQRLAAKQQEPVKKPSSINLLPKKQFLIDVDEEEGEDPYPLGSRVAAQHQDLRAGRSKGPPSVTNSSRKPFLYKDDIEEANEMYKDTLPNSKLATQRRRPPSTVGASVKELISQGEDSEVEVDEEHYHTHPTNSKVGYDGSKWPFGETKHRKKQPQREEDFEEEHVHPYSGNIAALQRHNKTSPIISGKQAWLRDEDDDEDGEDAQPLSSYKMGGQNAEHKAGQNRRWSTAAAKKQLYDEESDEEENQYPPYHATGVQYQELGLGKDKRLYTTAGSAKKQAQYEHNGEFEVDKGKQRRRPAPAYSHDDVLGQRKGPSTLQTPAKTHVFDDDDEEEELYEPLSSAASNRKATQYQDFGPGQKEATTTSASMWKQTRVRGDDDETQRRPQPSVDQVEKIYGRPSQRLSVEGTNEAKEDRSHHQPLSDAEPGLSSKKTTPYRVNPAKKKVVQDEVEQDLLRAAVLTKNELDVSPSPMENKRFSSTSESMHTSPKVTSEAKYRRRPWQSEGAKEEIPGRPLSSSLESSSPGLSKKATTSYKVNSDEKKIMEDEVVKEGERPPRSSSGRAQTPPSPPATIASPPTQASSATSVSSLPPQFKEEDHKQRPVPEAKVSPSPVPPPARPARTKMADSAAAPTTTSTTIINTTTTTLTTAISDSTAVLSTSTARPSDTPSTSGKLPTATSAPVLPATTPSSASSSTATVVSSTSAAGGANPRLSHVHPKLPDADEVMARMEALRQARQQRANAPSK